MTNVVQSVEELIQSAPGRNNEASFQTMWRILGDVRQKIADRFALTKHPSCADLADYGTPDGSTRGHLTAWTGDEIDWMIHSYMGTPAHSFSNMHLTVWLGPQIDAPHFGMALGTIPDMFVYLDYIPRTDVTVDLGYLDRYYEPQNKTFMDFEADPDFRPFVSRSLYMRQAQSRTSLCYMAPASASAIAKVEAAAHAAVDQWLLHVDAARQVPLAEQAALAARDQLVRRTIAQRDPANVMGEKIFGKELTDRLVGMLWGKELAANGAKGWQQ